MHRQIARPAVVGLLLAALVGCATAKHTTVRARTTVTIAPATKTPSTKVAVIVMENHEANAVLHNPKAPFVNALAARSARAANWFALRHPSLPNYLAMIGGSTFGVTDDCTDCNQTAPSLVDQLEARGVTWRAYLQGMPSACFPGAGAGLYAKKHNPFAYFEPITGNPARCQQVVPFDRLATDEANGSLPRFSFITPDLCNDTHDCGVEIGDQFLATTVPPLVNALGPDGVLVITYDEGSTNAGCCQEASGGRVLTVFAGGRARSGAVVDTALDHYSLLRTIEDLFGLDHLGLAGCPCTAPATELLRQ